MDSKWFKRWSNRSKCDSKPTLQLDEQLLDLMCHRMQKSFDVTLDKLLRKFLDYNLNGNFLCRSGDFIHDETNKLFRRQLCIKLLNNYIKYFRKKKVKSKSVMDPPYQEIVEYCTNGQYRLLSGEAYDKPNTFQDHNLERPIQIYWDISKVTDNAQFIYESEANKIFGLGRKRLIRLHPHLIHYILDREDCHWLHNNGLLKHSNTGRDSIVLFDQLRELRETSVIYKNFWAETNFAKVKVFKLPNFMLKKIRFYIIRLQIKTNGKITIVDPHKNEKQSPMLPATSHKRSIGLQCGRRRNFKAPRDFKRQTNISRSRDSMECKKEKMKSKSMNNLYDIKNRKIKSTSEDTLIAWKIKAMEYQSQRASANKSPLSKDKNLKKTDSDITLVPNLQTVNEANQSKANQSKLQNDRNPKTNDSDITLAPQSQSMNDCTISDSSSVTLHLEQKYHYTPPRTSMDGHSRSFCNCGLKDIEIAKTQRLVSKLFHNTTPLKSPRSSFYKFKYPSLQQIFRRT